jgi:nucleotide-binding universal stress UspA family protein
MFERILVPLDGSPAAELILSQIRRILFRKDAEIVLLQAVENPPLFGGSVSSARAQAAANARAYLLGQEDKLTREGARVRSLVRDGSPAGTILETAMEEESTLIAMTTHGRTGLSRWVFGSVAETVLRSSPIPLLMTRSFVPDAAGQAQAAPQEELTLRKILVPLEISDLSLEIVPYAAEMARLFEAKVLLFNACGKKVACDVPVVELTRAYETLREAGVTAEPLMRQGDPASAILEACRSEGVDLIAMTTHARSGMARVALGSVTEKVLRHSALPMLVTRGVHLEGLRRDRPTTATQR